MIPFNIGGGVELVPIRIELLQASYDPVAGFFRLEVRVSDRDDGSLIELSVALTAEVSESAPVLSGRMLAEALRRALVQWMDHEACELIRVNGERIFEDDAKDFH